MVEDIKRRAASICVQLYFSRMVLIDPYSSTLNIMSVTRLDDHIIVQALKRPLSLTLTVSELSVFFIKSRDMVRWVSWKRLCRYSKPLSVKLAIFVHLFECAFSGTGWYAIILHNYFPNRLDRYCLETIIYLAQ